ncbi:MAG: glycosyltransferase family 2 protein [Chloroflexota bacterium]
MLTFAPVWQSKRVVVVFPAYNEAANIALAVSEFRAIEAVDEVLVVDNNSRDETASLASRAGARVVQEARQGYGAALQRGLREADGDIVILAEPDGTFVPKDVLKLLAYSDEFDMVMGTRTTRDLIWAQANMGWFLRVGNVAVAKLLQVLFGGPSLSDCGCTLRLLHRSTVEAILPDLTVTSSHFLPQMVIAALRRRLRVIEVPVNYRGRVGESKITGSVKTAVTVGLRMIGLIVRSRVRA